MENGMLRTTFRSGRALLTGVALCLLAPGAAAWGPTAHQAVAARAIDTLPKGLKEFYKAHRYEMPTLALEPSLPEDTPERRFLVDRLLPFPFSDLPAREDAFKARFGAEAPPVGRLAWLIQESYDRLVAAFKAGDKDAVLKESDLVAALVADLTNPLAVTDNFDGTKTGQHGLYLRFSNKLPESMEKSLKLDPDAAHYLDDPKGHVFSLLASSFVWVDNILYLEDLAHRGLPGYGSIYYDAATRRLGPIVKERLSLAAEAAGSYWYTAWSAAGRPALQ